MILRSKLKNGPFKIDAKSQFVTKFDVTISRVHFIFEDKRVIKSRVNCIYFETKLTSHRTLQNKPPTSMLR